MDISREQELEDQIALLQQQLQEITGSSQELGAIMTRGHGITHRLAMMLVILVKRAPAVVSKGSFHSLIYGHDADGGPEPKIFAIHISRLRSWLKRQGCPGKIHTVWGAGYRASPELVSWVQELYASHIIKEK